MNKLKTDATDENLSQVTEFVDAFLEQHQCSMKMLMQFDLAVEEVFVNIAHYAYGENTGWAEITLAEHNGEITVIFEDGGTPYNPLAKEDPDITLSVEERKIGGLGIFLVKKNMDSVTYAYENGRNVLTLKKRISQQKD